MSANEAEISAAQFLAELVRPLGEDRAVRVVATAFLGDPAAADKTRWRAVGVDPERLRAPGNAEFNRYVTIAAFARSADGTWRRKRERFGAALAVMV